MHLFVFAAAMQMSQSAREDVSGERYIFIGALFLLTTYVAFLILFDE